MDIRKRMLTFLKRSLDKTYITKRDFKETFEDLRGNKTAKGVLFKNTKQQIYVFPSKKTIIWKTKDKERTAYQFNRFIITPGKRKGPHLLIEADPEVFQSLVKSEKLSKKSFISRRNATKIIVRERYLIPVDKKFVSKSPSIEIKLPPKEMSNVKAQLQTLAIKQRNFLLKRHLEKLLRTHELNEVLRMGFTIQDIMLFLPALKLPVQKKQKLIDQMFSHKLFGK